MRVQVAVTAALACATATSVALAGNLPATLEGNVDRGGAATIKITKDRIQGTPVEKYRWDFRRLTVRCDGRLRKADDPVRYGFSINAEYGGPGRWGIQTVKWGEDEHDPKYAFRVGGRLVSWNKAKGWVRVWGSEVSLRSGGRADCDSGRLHWVTVR